MGPKNGAEQLFSKVGGGDLLGWWLGMTLCFGARVGWVTAAR